MPLPTFTRTTPSVWVKAGARHRPSKCTDSTGEKDDAVACPAVVEQWRVLDLENARDGIGGRREEEGEVEAATTRWWVSIRGGREGLRADGDGSFVVDPDPIRFPRPPQRSELRTNSVPIPAFEVAIVPSFHLFAISIRS
ncbi:hypothetical protein FA13DRAFT_1058610 [Coprinellus micaceus]|uniref:Uncharacterized protein n=1 Tax=Coprinellus micaceus TaxID=71717 RepID=A0A4Y7RL78_COPMI|nr:hypothetical protein FA13DRAFT_1058610 [Coprinellus micaceus]